MKKIVGSLLLLAVVLTVVFPVVAFASSSAPMTANEMKAVIGGQPMGLCDLIGEATHGICIFFGGDYHTCAIMGLGAYAICSAI